MKDYSHKKVSELTPEERADLWNRILDAYHQGGGDTALICPLHQKVTELEGAVAALQASLQLLAAALLLGSST